MSATVEAPADSVTPSLFADYIAVSKMRITLASIVAAGVGFYLGLPGAMEAGAVTTLVVMSAGLSLVVAGANAANQVIERAHDARMIRTSDRPIPAGRLSARQVSLFVTLCSITGLGLLVLGVNWMCAATALVSFLLYVFVYTPLKRLTPWSLWVGAVPGALPPMIGWAAATGGLEFRAWTLFAIMFLWQLPHFMAIAWIYREDYAAAGYPVVPVVEPSGRSMVRQMVVYSLVLIPVSLLPSAFYISGPVYYVGALVLGFTYLAFAIEVGRLRTQISARQHLWASLAYLTLIFLLMAFDKVGTEPLQA